MTLTSKQKKYLESIYRDLKKGGSYQSPSKIYKTVQNEGKHKIRYEDIKEWLKSEESYTLNKDVRFRFPKTNVISAGINDIWEADLCDYQKFKSKNNNYSYLLGVICIFSRKLYVEPLKTKVSSEVIKAFRSILSKAGGKCNSLRTDMGSEFTNHKFKEFLRNQEIGHYYSHGTAQCAFIERVWRSLKKRITKFMKETNTKKYIDKIDDFVEGYNNTYHTSIGRRPIEVNKQNESEVAHYQYLNREKRKSRDYNKFVDKKPKFSLNETVRIAKRKDKITNEYTERWSREIYFIDKIISRQGMPIYYIRDDDNERLLGSFYESELQSVDLPSESKLYEIEKIVRKRKVGKKSQVLVKWKGFDKKFNTWMDEKDVMTLEN